MEKGMYLVEAHVRERRRDLGGLEFAGWTSRVARVEDA